MTPTTISPLPFELPEKHGNTRFKSVIQMIPVTLVAGVFIILVVLNPNIVGFDNLEAIIVSAVPSTILAIGMSIIIAATGDDVITGGVDLSLPNQAVLAAAVMALSLGHGIAFWVSLLISMLVALSIGVLNSILTVTLHMAPILATLATSVLVDGITRKVTSNKRIEVHDATVIAFRDNSVLGIPIVILAAIMLLFAAHMLVHHTTLGLNMQAVGGNKGFAVESGIRPNLTIACAFLIASICAGLSCVTLLSRASGWSTGSEDQLLLDMLLATYLAPVFSRRGTYTPVGACTGAVLVSALSNALILGGVDNSLIDGAKGLLILVVVSSTSLSRRNAV